MAILYEPQYAITGWLDNSGYRELSWFWRDLSNDVPITLTFLEPIFVDDPDVIFVPPPITVELLAGFYDDPDTLFTPIAIRALKQSDTMLKNEVRRIR